MHQNADKEVRRLKGEIAKAHQNLERANRNIEDLKLRQGQYMAGRRDYEEAQSLIESRIK